MNLFELAMLTDPIPGLKPGMQLRQDGERFYLAPYPTSARPLLGTLIALCERSSMTIYFPSIDGLSRAQICLIVAALLAEENDDA